MNTLPSVVLALYGAGNSTARFFQKPGVQPSWPGGGVVGGGVVGGGDVVDGGGDVVVELDDGDVGV